MNLARIYAIAFGAVYTLVGVLGMFVSTTLATGTLILFPVNVVHNIVHLAIGLAGIAAYMTGRSVEYCRGAAVLFLVLVIAGFLPQPLLGIVPLGGADIALHAVSGILAAVAGWMYANRGERRSNVA